MVKKTTLSLLYTYYSEFTIIHLINLKLQIFVFFIAIFFTNNLIAQDLYIGNNTYLYSRDDVVTVTNDIRMETPTSNFFLRGDAQLYQIADTKNSDAGELSIYQNQTTNIYEYNYWASPVGVSVDGTTAANVDFNGSNIHDPQDETDLTNVNSSAYAYTTAYNGTATELSNYWIYTLKEGEGYYSWTQVFDTGNIGTGYGFTLKGSPNSNNVLDFRGRPNNGTITVSCAFDGVDNQPTSGTPNTAETLTGNPYPSALDLKLFITDGTGPIYTTNNRNVLSGEIFFWEQKQKNSHYLADYEGGYGIYIPGDPSNLSDNGTYAVAAFENYNGDGSTNSTTSGNTTDFSLNNSRRYAAVGQGFIITSNGAGGNAVFENKMRVYLPEDSTSGGNGSIFAKNSNSKTSNTKEKIVPMSHNGVDYKAIMENPTIIPEIRIHTHVANKFYKENVIAFRNNTPNNNTYNRFFDGKNINELSSDSYLISEDKLLSIKSIRYDENTKLNLGLKAGNDNTPFSIKIHKLNNIPNNVDVYLFDNLNNTYTDIKNNSFDIILNKGVYNNRFQIVFSKNTTLNNEEFAIETLNIIENNNTTSELKVLNPNALEIKTFDLYDILGKILINKNEQTSKKEFTYSTKGFSDGLYIAKVVLSNGQVFSKKIIIKNK